MVLLNLQKRWPVYRPSIFSLEIANALWYIDYYNKIEEGFDNR